MQLPPLFPASLIKRYKRFLADVRLENGEQITIHCPNTGAMTACADAGNRIWYSLSNNPKRKYAGTWELCENAQQQLICVNTQRANQVVAEALQQGLIKPLQGYQQQQREVPYGDEGSRIDFKLSQVGRADAYLEVKSVTLLEQGQGFFPDSVSLRGQKHLRELIQVANSGQRAVLLFAVLHTGINSVQAAAHIDPHYAQLLHEAQTAGVEVLAFAADISPQHLHLHRQLPVVNPPIC